jgi:hypothetical protein
MREASTKLIVDNYESLRGTAHRVPHPWVNAEFIRKAASRGYRNLSAGDLLDLKIRGRLDRGES